jgi:hypothetical protein
MFKYINDFINNSIVINNIINNKMDEYLISVDKFNNINNPYTYAYMFKNEVLPYMLAHDIVNMSPAVSKNRVDGDMCCTCGKIFYGYRYKKRLLQHCDTLSHDFPK